ncbi:dipeptidase [Ferrovibrio xuzhouensis]|uniref:Dipeptidase n=1 Tax=Ferrovibrio xuzhouensis TaxID=1576914 RepID=A0ABV7VC13_9PROT
MSMAAWRERHSALQDLPVCDGLLPWTSAFLPPGADLPAMLRRYRQAGIDHVSLTAAAGRDDTATALSRLGWFRRILQPHGDWVSIADGRHGIEAARAGGQMSVSFHFQTATPLLDDLEYVDAFRAAGVWRTILAYNEANTAGDGCHEPRNAGLSAFGRRLIARMDAAGMGVDLSHCGERTSLEAIEATAGVPVFSHSNARALFDHERNITDVQIRACAARGGYVGISGVGFFLGADGDGLPAAVARNVAYIADLVGPQHVGLGLDVMYLEGSDYGFFHGSRERWPRGYPNPPWSFLQPEQFDALVEAIIGHGFSKAEIAGILGGNLLRCMPR